MNSHWQMTMEEILGGKFKPVRRIERTGVLGYYCPLCGGVVGVRNTMTEDEEVHEYYKEKCINGHEMEWESKK